MNWFQKTLLYIGLLIVFLFAFNVNGSTVETIQTEKIPAAFASESNHFSAFVQPQASSTLAVHYKTTDYSITKYFGNFLVVIPNFSTSKFFSTFRNQDINRCEMVSLLLFPFHFFW